MRLPRDINAPQLVRDRRRLDYELLRQRGSHIRMAKRTDGRHFVLIPNHFPIRTKTLSGILKDIADHHGMTVDELLSILDL